jgi:2-polyprenyl-3-methyl-5-hydroxy-6-metoxy-1,4-benzoquinol methylase
MFSKRSNQRELMDDFSLHEEALRMNLKEIEAINRWLGSEKSLISAINFLYQQQYPRIKKNEIFITDLGCGSGDLLRAISRWGQTKAVNINLMGIDANEFILNHAKIASKQFPNIKYELINILSNDFKKLRFDITTLNSFCHHLSDNELIILITQLQRQNRLGIIINDLHRHWIPYFTIKYISKFLNFSYLAKHDGPLSVLRAFQKKELIHILTKANVKSYRIRWVWPFRWQVIISNLPDISCKKRTEIYNGNN